MSDTKAVNAVISGKVQGVWYRAWTVEQARKRGLAGWVRNRNDGTVEAVFAGPAEQGRRHGPSLPPGTAARQGRRRGGHAGIVSPWRDLRAALDLLSSRTSSSHSCSVSVVTPSACALAALLPASAPTTT